MLTFFTSDLHFGCENLRRESRAEFATIEEHDETLFDALNSTVGRRDRLVMLGDFCLKKPGRYRPKIRCRNIVVVLGNHDSEAKMRSVFGGQVYHMRMIKGEHTHFFCCHYPMAAWNRSHYGTYHCHGHWHANKEYEDSLDIACPGRRSLDVGVDSAKRYLGEWRPFTEVEALDLMPGPGYGIVHQ